LKAKRLAYFLLLLLISAQLDDAWAAAPASPPAPIAEENDEYLPAQRRPQDEQIALAHWPPFAGLKAQPADLSVAQKCPPSGPNPAPPFAPKPLLAFMPLRI
jgi:hypothetical protein